MAHSINHNTSHSQVFLITIQQLIIEVRHLQNLDEEIKEEIKTELYDLYIHVRKEIDKAKSQQP